MEVSIVIPTYNRKDLAQRAIRSVIAQVGASFEVIVVDDGSTDGTFEALAKAFPSVRMLRTENKGPAAARNRGIEIAEAPWIAFLDSDDEWKPGKLKAQLDFFKVRPEIQIAQTEETWIRNGKRVNPMKKHAKHAGWIFEACLPLCIVSPSAVMIHRNLFEAIGTFDESLPACEDYDLWLRMAAKKEMGLIREPYVIKYGGHADQRSHEFPAMDRFRIESLVKILKSRTLDPEQGRVARQMLLEKSKIYTKGTLKRGNQVEAERIQTLIQSIDETLQTT